MKSTIILFITLFFSFCLNAQTVWTNKTKLKGKIGSYEIVMTLAVPYGGATSCFTIGEYYYSNVGKIINLCSEDDERIVETVDGNATGYFILENWDKKIGQEVRGSWHSIDGKRSFPVSLIVIKKAN